VRNKPLIWPDPSGLGHWEVIDGNKFWVGDSSGEYDESTKLYWNSKTREWGERPKATKPTSFAAGFLLGLTGIHDMFARWILGEDTSQTRFLREVQRDNPKTGTAGEITGAVTGGAVAGGLAGAGRGTTQLGIARGPSFLSMLSPKDAKIIQLAIEKGASSSGNFMQNLNAFSDAMAEVIPGGKVYPLGNIGGSPIYGSAISRVGIAEVNGATMVVKAPLGGTPRILGALK
jgi:hypothetical protein